MANYDWRGTVAEFITRDGEDIDVYDNYTEELGIAWCYGPRLTEAGLEKFGEVLGYEVEVYSDDESALVLVDADGLTEKEIESRLEKAKEFFDSAAGLCSSEDWDTWFTYPEDDK